MKFLALVSGGKDSCYSILHSLRQGHELVALGNLYPADQDQQELDSFMFQTVGHDIVNWYQKCTGLPLFRRAIHPQTSKNVSLNYYPTDDDEIEDLLELLKEAKKQMPEIEAVNAGAILSSYQRTRVEDVCSRLGLVVLSYLWQRDQRELMTEMCSMSKHSSEPAAQKMDARIIKTAAVGLDDRHLAKSLPEMFPILQKLNHMYEVHICGEGGEYETMVFDGPFFFHGYLEPTLLDVEGSGNSDGVYSARMKVNFVERSSHLSTAELLENLPVPPILEEKWIELLDEVSDLDPPSKTHSPSVLDSLYRPKVAIKSIGHLLCVSNLTPRGGSSADEKVQDVFRQLSDILRDYELSPAQILSSLVLLADMGDFSKVNVHYNEFFHVARNGPLPPSRACVGSSSVGSENILQLSVIVDTSSHTHKQGEMTLYENKNGLHVQGRSYWAPCNIGPYSQATWNKTDANQVSYISGQIALIPSSMEMVETLHPDASPGASQCLLSLRHFDTLKTTIQAQCQLNMTCYVAQEYMVPIVSNVWSLYCTEMGSKSEMWFDKENDDPKSLIIVKVSSLPRQALCEWGGTTCKTLKVEDEEDDDVICREAVNPRSDCFQASVENKDETRVFTTLFMDSKEEVVETLKEQSSCSTKLFYRPSTQAFDTDGVECCPVEKIYDYKGRERFAALHLMRHHHSTRR